MITGRRGNKPPGLRVARGRARPAGLRALGNPLNKELERAPKYREQAAELLRLRERSTDTRQQAMLIELATRYHRMAEQIEEANKLDIEPSKKEPD